MLAFPGTHSQVAWHASTRQSTPPAAAVRFDQCVAATGSSRSSWNPACCGNTDNRGSLQRPSQQAVFFQYVCLRTSQDACCLACQHMAEHSSCSSCTVRPVHYRVSRIIHVHASCACAQYSHVHLEQWQETTQLVHGMPAHGRALLLQRCNWCDLVCFWFSSICHRRVLPLPAPSKVSVVVPLQTEAESEMNCARLLPHGVLMP